MGLFLPRSGGRTAPRSVLCLLLPGRDAGATSRPPVAPATVPGNAATNTNPRCLGPGAGATCATLAAPLQSHNGPAPGDFRLGVNVARGSLVLAPGHSSHTSVVKVLHRVHALHCWRIGQPIPSKRFRMVALSIEHICGKVNTLSSLPNRMCRGHNFSTTEALGRCGSRMGD
jgi:hypothetical protein